MAWVGERWFSDGRGERGRLILIAGEAPGGGVRSVRPGRADGGETESGVGNRLQARDELGRQHRKQRLMGGEEICFAGGGGDEGDRPDELGRFGSQLLDDLGRNLPDRVVEGDDGFGGIGVAHILF